MKSARLASLLSSCVIGLGALAGAAHAGSTQSAARPADPALFANLPLRPIGPALTSGRIVALAVDPKDSSTYYVGAASGGVWKTANAGTSWNPVFEREASYSIGALVLDPHDSNVVWVGTGELNAQRSVGYGDGVYRSDDGGRSWRNVGLKRSEHIGRIAIHPYDSSVVYVAAQGPLWGAGGDRGLFKTEDGGKSWKPVLTVSENTGVTDVVIDPKRPDTLYAATWQRRRHIFTYLGGGPESGIYRSTDAGATWTRLRGGLPAGDVGRIGLAISPADPKLLYATIEAGGAASGTYASTDGGTSWERRGNFVAQGMYYGQITADPKDPERIYLPSVILTVSDDGGRTTRPLGERNKHVDNHVIWIDPADTRHYLVGCDGGLYESFDRGATWQFKPNLPIAQFYRVAVDDAKPFYHVYGGTQDNNSLGGPSRTRSPGGIANSDWYITLGGDGFHQQVDPTDPDIVYSTLQYGGLSRMNRRTGERVGIQPVEGAGELPLRWNWDSPLLISPHSPTRLYFAANRLFRSDDRGNSWRAISADLTRQLDRNRLPVMGKLWGIDAVAKHQSTSAFGNIVSLAESPKQEGLIYIGTDDGLVQVTEDGGGRWRKLDDFPGVPEMTYVSRIVASRHDADTVYAAFNNHQNGDFKPYLLKSTDRGRSWHNLAESLPENSPIWALVEDPAVPNLLFLGTEFGLYFTVDGGKKWIRYRGGLPTIPVRDLAIQARETDLVVGTFGRGIYILDDYTPLRVAATQPPTSDAALIPARETLAYVPYSPVGFGAGSQGETFYLAPNPPYGAAITYYLREGVKTRRQLRLEREAEATRNKKEPPYPTAEELRAEAEEDPPATILTISDADGTVVRRLTGPAAAGVFRVTWDLRTGVAGASAGPPGEGGEGGGGRRGGGGRGFPVPPGAYRVSLARRSGGQVTELVPAVPISVVAEGERQLSDADRQALTELRKQVLRLQRAVSAADGAVEAALARVAVIKQGAQESPEAPPRLREDALALEAKLRAVQLALRGDRAAAAREELVPPSILERVSDVMSSLLGSASVPTGTRRQSFEVASQEFGQVLERLRPLLKQDLERLEQAAEAAGLPPAPGRLPDR